MRGVAAAIVFALALSGCSSSDTPQPGLGKIALEIARARLAKRNVETVETETAPQVTRAQMEALGRPVVFVSVPRLGTGLPAVEIATNRGFKTYMGADQATVTLNRGTVTATRGLPVDLFAQDLGVTPADLFEGEFPKAYARSQRHLTGEGTLETKEYTCAIAPAEADEELKLFGETVRVRQFTELCRNKVRAFQNSYWVDDAGTVWQSHQSISKEVGHIIIQRVVK